jgi:hypothetical protein
MILILGGSGCHKNECVYPKFPAPSQKVLNDLKNTNSQDVSDWLKELIKLKEKLKG